MDTKVYVQVRCSENNVGVDNFIPELLYFSIVYIIQKLGTLSLKHLQVSIHFCHGLSGYLCLYVNLQRFGGHAVFVSSL